MFVFFKLGQFLQVYNFFLLKWTSGPKPTKPKIDRNRTEPNILFGFRLFVRSFRFRFCKFGSVFSCVFFIQTRTEPNRTDRRSLLKSTFALVQFSSLFERSWPNFGSMSGSGQVYLNLDQFCIFYSLWSILRVVLWPEI